MNEAEAGRRNRRSGLIYLLFRVQVVLSLAVDGQPTIQGAAEAPGDKPLEQVVHVHHEGRRRGFAPPVDEGQMIEEQPGETEGRPVVLVQPRVMDASEIIPSYTRVRNSRRRSITVSIGWDRFR